LVLTRTPLDRTHFPSLPSLAFFVAKQPWAAQDLESGGLCVDPETALGQASPLTSFSFVVAVDVDLQVC
jgi:hypothetical protein